MGMPTAESPLAGIVLAGGLSSRMGRDKATLQRAGETLLARACRVLYEAGADPVRVSGDYPQFAGIVDVVPRQGPLGGLYSVLPSLSDGWAWVIPVDMPHLESTLLVGMMQAAGHDTAACIRYGAEPLPMLLRVDARSRALISARVHDACAPRSLRALQAGLGVIEIPVDAALRPLLANCNSPAEWNEALP